MLVATEPAARRLTWSAIKPFASQHANLAHTFRVEFATSISATFSRVKLAQLARWLGLEAGEAASWAAEEAGWSVEGESVVVPGNGDNDVKAGVVKENIELSRECLPPADPVRMITRCPTSGSVETWSISRLSSSARTTLRSKSTPPNSTNGQN